MHLHRSTRVAALCAAIALLGCGSSTSGSGPGDGDDGEDGGDGDGHVDARVPGDGGDSADAGPELNPWLLIAASSQPDSLRSVAALPDGSLVVTGSTEGALDLGGGVLPHAGESDAFVARFAPDGAHVWSTRLAGGPALDMGLAAVVAPDGDILIGGLYEGTVAIGAVEHAGHGEPDVFVARLDPSDGSPIWSYSFGSPGFDQVLGMTMAGDDVVLTGTVAGEVDLGGGPVDGARSAFVLRLAGDGAYRWSRVFHGTYFVQGHGVATNPGGDVLATGQFFETADFGGDDLVSFSESDIYLVELDGETGDHHWSRAFPGTSYQHARAIAVDAGGDIVLAGDFSANVSFGGPTLRTGVIGGQSDAFVAKLDPAGEHIWSVQLDTPPGYNDVGSLALLADGRIAAAGSIEPGTYAVLLDPATAATLSRLTFTGPGVLQDHHIATAAAGMVAVTGFFQGTVDFGTGPITGGTDGFLVVDRF
jgi:outer membrane protein assembly factor BamB